MLNSALTLKKLQAILKRKKKTNKVVLIGGSFDLVHPAHIAQIKKSATYGDTLVVGLTSDKNIKKRKGPLRPINTAADRAKVIQEIKGVDYVFVSDDSAYSDLVIRALEPRTIVFSFEGGKGRHRTRYKADFEKRFPGLQVRFVPGIAKYSTTKTIERIMKKYGDI